MFTDIKKNLKVKFGNYDVNFISDLSVHFSAEQIGIRTIKTKYIATISHNELSDTKVLSDYYLFVLEGKVIDYVEKLQAKYFKYVEKERVVQTQLSAEKASNEAKERLVEFESILSHTLKINDAVNWEFLKDFREFSVENPMKSLNSNIDKVSKPQLLPRKPSEDDYKPNFNFFDYIIPALKNKKIIKANSDLESAIENWEELKIKIQKEEDAYKNEIKELNSKFLNLEKEWETERENYYKEQAKVNLDIEELKNKYESGDDTAVEEYCNIVLNTSYYPDGIPQTFSLIYNPTNKLLVIDYDLPSIDCIPKIKEVKFISKEVRELQLSESDRLSLYESTLYRICLRTIHEIFEADTFTHIETVCFNGWVNALDKAKGNLVNSCIMSIQTEKDEFMAINLSKIDEKACFKSLKGVGSSKLSGMSAVQPIIKIDRNDKRIIEHYDVADGINESTNLASMDWEDFENLIREVFEREFQSNGGEVKVTQASRDGGVDAIAFDPDPIRGGKIVIQAKRYTNTVGVSAVRDLYGTVNHEGATKGILVTTADYGPDAYTFAKGKPLTLLNGGNLLYLLEKHGFKAKIDILEAKQNNLNKEK